MLHLKLIPGNTLVTLNLELLARFCASESNCSHRWDLGLKISGGLASELSVVAAEHVCSDIYFATSYFSKLCSRCISTSETRNGQLVNISFPLLRKCSKCCYRTIVCQSTHTKCFYCIDNFQLSSADLIPISYRLVEVARR
jgi:hypothetical protein